MTVARCRIITAKIQRENNNNHSNNNNPYKYKIEYGITAKLYVCICIVYLWQCKIYRPTKYYNFCYLFVARTHNFTALFWKKNKSLKSFWLLLLSFIYASLDSRAYVSYYLNCSNCYWVFWVFCPLWSVNCAFECWFQYEKKCEIKFKSNNCSTFNLHRRKNRKQMFKMLKMYSK